MLAYAGALWAGPSMILRIPWPHIVLCFSRRCLSILPLLFSLSFAHVELLEQRGMKSSGQPEAACKERVARKERTGYEERALHVS